MDKIEKKDIKSMTLEEMTEEIKGLGDKGFRGKQIYQWIHQKLADSFDDMTNLSKGLREKLRENYELTSLKLLDVKVSAVDGTRKYLFGLKDGNVIESSISTAILNAFPPR